MYFCNYSNNDYDLITMGDIGGRESVGLSGLDNYGLYKDYYRSMRRRMEKDGITINETNKKATFTASQNVLKDHGNIVVLENFAKLYNRRNEGLSSDILAEERIAAIYQQRKLSTLIKNCHILKNK